MWPFFVGVAYYYFLTAVHTYYTWFAYSWLGTKCDLPSCRVASCHATLLGSGKSGAVWSCPLPINGCCCASYGFR